MKIVEHLQAERGGFKNERASMSQLDAAGMDTEDSYGFI